MKTGKQVYQFARARRSAGEHIRAGGFRPPLSYNGGLSAAPIAGDVSRMIGAGDFSFQGSRRRGMGAVSHPPRDGRGRREGAALHRSMISIALVNQYDKGLMCDLTVY